MQNVGMTFMLGMGQAILGGVSSMSGGTGDGLRDIKNNTGSTGSTGSTVSTGYNYTSQNQINNRFNYMSSSYQGF